MEELVFDQYLDLRGTPCPMNFVRCCLFLENLAPQSFLKVDLDKGEPETMVISGVRNHGYSVEIIDQQSTWLTLMITCEQN